MRESSSGQELKIKEVDTRIEREIAELRTAIQSSKVCLSFFSIAFFMLNIFCAGRYSAVSCWVRYVVTSPALLLFWLRSL